MLVIDCRGATRTALEETLALLRRGDHPEVPVVAIGSLESRAELEIIGTLGHRFTDLILADRESLGVRLRAILNDRTGTAASAVALAVLSEDLHSEAAPILEAVHGGGMQATNAKTVSAALGQERSKLERDLRRVGAPLPSEIIDVAKGAHALVEARSSPLSEQALARSIGFAKSRPLRELLMRVFGCSVPGIRAESPDMEAGKFLKLLLARRRARTSMNVPGSGAQRNVRHAGGNAVEGW